jgi:hypothetical protein
MLHRVGALELVTDVGLAAWIVERLHPFAQDVGSVVPEGFETYVRVFHPAYLSALDGSRVPVRWCEIAIANGRIVHPEMQFPGITGLPGITPHSQPEVWDEQPEEGSMPLDLANRLAAILAVHTGTPKSCWFAIWEGFGDLRIPRDAAPRFSIPCRDLFLLRGPVEAIAESLSEIEGAQETSCGSMRTSPRSKCSVGTIGRRTSGGARTGRGAWPPKSTGWNGGVRAGSPDRLDP